FALDHPRDLILDCIGVDEHHGNFSTGSSLTVFAFAVGKLDLRPRCGLISAALHQQEAEVVVAGMFVAQITPEIIGINCHPFAPSRVTAYRLDCHPSTAV